MTFYTRIDAILQRPKFISENILIGALTRAGYTQLPTSCNPSNLDPSLSRILMERTEIQNAPSIEALFTLAKELEIGITELEMKIQAQTTHPKPSNLGFYGNFSDQMGGEEFDYKEDCIQKITDQDGTLKGYSLQGTNIFISRASVLGPEMAPIEIQNAQNQVIQEGGSIIGAYQANVIQATALTSTRAKIAFYANKMPQTDPELFEFLGKSALTMLKYGFTK